MIPGMTITLKKVILKIPKEWHQWLSGRASKSDRTVEQEIIHMLEGKLLRDDPEVLEEFLHPRGENKKKS